MFPSVTVVFVVVVVVIAVVVLTIDLPVPLQVNLVASKEIVDTKRQSSLAKR